jgi:hypothetical protein
MNLRMRLQRLERQAAAVQARLSEPRDLFAEIEQGVAYLRGEGPRPPDPPCPAWFDPQQWASRLRQSSCLEERMRGALAADEYLPGMDEAERAYVDDLFHLLTTGMTELIGMPAEGDS